MIAPERVVERAHAKVAAPAQPGACVLSTYSVGSHGYPQIGWGEDGHTRMVLVHRVVWQAAYGPIPDGMTVDHICRERRCVNVDHLRLLSNRVNGTLNGNALKSHCPKGHPYDEANTDLRRHHSGRLHRFCRACTKAANDARPRNPRTTPTAAQAILAVTDETDGPVPLADLVERLPAFKASTVMQIADRLARSGQLDRPAPRTYRRLQGAG